MKFLYLLVSEDKDIYYEQTLVSVLSLRHYNPEAFITLIVDDRTDLNLVGFRAEIKKHIDEYKVIPFEASVSNMVRSRLLKTNMRNLLEGDFLYIDGDTAITSPLQADFSTLCDVCAIADLHAGKNDSYLLKHKKNNLHKNKMNFKLSLGDIYFNGGVVFVKDSLKAREFFDKWHALYKKCNEKGIFTDQISFNETNHLLGFMIKELPGEWNCQVREAYNHLYRVKIIYPLLCKAKIIHFFGSGIDGKKEPHPCMKKEFFENIKKAEKLDSETLDIVYNAKTAFVGAPKQLNPKVKFPLFFIYRQFPRLFKALNFIRNLLKKNS